MAQKKKSKKAEPARLAGKVVSLNVSPHGHVEGALLQTKAGIVQLNLPKHAPEGAMALVPGSTVDVVAEPFEAEGQHPVFVVTDDQAARGTITRLNYTLHAEVNGYHLDDGTFVHVKPDGARKYGLQVGHTIVARGKRREGGIVVVVEAREVEKVAPTARRARSST